MGTEAIQPMNNFQNANESVKVNGPHMQLSPKAAKLPSIKQEIEPKTDNADEEEKHSVGALNKRQQK